MPKIQQNSPKIKIKKGLHTLSNTENNNTDTKKIRPKRINRRLQSSTPSLMNDELNLIERDSQRVTLSEKQRSRQAHDARHQEAAKTLLSLNQPIIPKPRQEIDDATYRNLRIEISKKNMSNASDIIDSIKISDSTILDQKTNIKPHNNILMIAAANNLNTIVRKLLLKGANPLLQNDLGQTARAVCDEKKNSATLEHLYLRYAQSSELLQKAEQLWLQNDSKKPYNIETLLMNSPQVSSQAKSAELNPRDELSPVSTHTKNKDTKECDTISSATQPLNTEYYSDIAGLLIDPSLFKPILYTDDNLNDGADYLGEYKSPILPESKQQEPQGINDRLHHYQYILHAYPANQNPTLSHQTAQTHLANSQPEDLSTPQISNTQNMLVASSKPNTQRSLGDFRK